MYPAKDAPELGILLRTSRELVNPLELLAWALALTDPDIVAWRAEDSGHRYLQAAADRNRAPVRGASPRFSPARTTRASGAPWASTNWRLASGRA